MERLALLKELSFGSRVAEEETQHLASYFVETYQWSRIERGEIDIIIGEKGTGKSAIYTLLTAKTDVFFDKNILLVAAETPRGNTVFKDLVANPPTSEHEFIVLWKLYILALAAERLRDLGFSDKNAQKLCDTLEDAGLLPKEFDIRAILRSVYGAAKRLLSAEALEITGTVDPNTSFPIATGKITLREPIDDRSRIGFISVDGLLRAANNSLSQMGYKLWVLFDRLDVAFAETLDLEANALRALIRVYADIRGLDFIGLKIFLREDIWKRVNEGGFRESSHLTRVDTLRWTNEYLLNLIVRRILINDVLVKEFDIDREAIMRDNDEKISLIKKLFPSQVDQGKKKPSTLKWMVTRCADAKEVTAPRELIHLLNELRTEEIKRLEKNNKMPDGDVLFDRSVFKLALASVSNVRLDQTIYAEYPLQKQLIEKLRNQKTEQTEESLGSLWGVDIESARTKADELVDLGFFQRRDRQGEATYWVPYLYRDALHMIQGKAEED